MLAFQLVAEVQLVGERPLVKMKLVFQLKHSEPNILLKTGLLLHHQCQVMVLIDRQRHRHLYMASIIQVAAFYSHQ